MKTDSPLYDPHGGDETIVEPKEKLENKSANPGASASPSSSSAIQERGKEDPPPPEKKFTLPPSIAWIPANFTWSQLKTVIRCSLTAWVSLLFTIIGPVSRSLGQVSANIQSRPDRD